MATIILPEDCDRAAAAAVLPELVAAAGAGPIAIDGTAVRRAGQAMLQVLLAARASHGGAVIAASEGLRRSAAIAGLEKPLFEQEAA